MSSSAINPAIGLSAWDSRMSGSLKANGTASEDDAKLKKVCKEMEGVFLNMMLQCMRKTLPKNPLDGPGSQKETLQSLFDMELTRDLAAGRGIGLADMMYRNLKNPGVKGPVVPKADK